VTTFGQAQEQRGYGTGMSYCGLYSVINIFTYSVCLWILK